jgi:WD repeat-containing protein 48
LGRWILRYLFAKLIDEEIKRDEAHRSHLNEMVEKRQQHAAPSRPPNSIVIPASNLQSWELNKSEATTPKANGNNFPMTPGLAIGVATPGGVPPVPSLPGSAVTPSSPADKRSSQISRPSGDDYFSSTLSSAVDAKPATTPAATETKEEVPKTPVTEKEKEKDTGKSPSTAFGKKFRMGMSFGTKKLGRSASSTQPEKPAVVEEKPEENTSESSSNHEKEVDDSFRGVIQKIRNEYDRQLQETPDHMVETKVTPSLPIDTPVLKLPPGTRVILQEETSGGIANLYRGTVETVGVDADIIEEKAPMWLGEVLLTVSFSHVLVHRNAILTTSRTRYR